MCPEDEKEEWARVLSTLEPPPNSEQLRDSTYGDDPVESVTMGEVAAEASTNDVNDVGSSGDGGVDTAESPAPVKDDEE